MSVGTLNALSIPDIPHMQEVCKANEAKFPDGKGVPHPTIPGKYGKPEGWTPPNHANVAAKYMQQAQITPRMTEQEVDTFLNSFQVGTYSHG